MMAMMLPSIFLAVALTGCSVVAEKGISVQLSPTDEKPIDGSLTSLQTKEVDEVTQITDTYFAQF